MSEPANPWVEGPADGQPDPLPRAVPAEEGGSSPRAEQGFLPAHPERSGSESVLVRLVATIGVIAIGTAIGAALSANDVAGWIISLVVATVSVALAAVLWRSRRL